MKKIKKPNFLEWNSNVLLDSLRRIDSNFFLIVFLDSLFYALSGLIIALWFQRVISRLYSFQLPSDIISLGYDRAQQLVKDVRLFYILLIVSFVLLLLAIIFIASILKGIIWAKTTKTKITLALVSKFLALNLIWMGFWLVLIVLMPVLLEPTISTFAIGIAIIISLYLTNTLYTFFMKEQKLGKMLKAIAFNASKIHFFLLPYSIIILLFILVVKASSLVKFNYSPIFTSLLIVIFAALVRYYHSALVIEIEKQK